MAVIKIPWNDGSGQFIYLTATAFNGNQTVHITSDPNAGLPRAQTLIFRAGNVTKELIVSQRSPASNGDFNDDFNIDFKI